MEKVTIGITTYNLEKYIRQALDSVLAQQTDFDFSILVVDDASKDGTVDILREYEYRFPDKIRVIYLSENGGSLRASNTLFNNIKTDYFSFLDGDDYWVSNDRLQKQVDFLDKHPEYTMCGGNTRYSHGAILSDQTVIDKRFLDKSYDYAAYELGQVPFVHTSSIVLRNVIYGDGIPKDYIENESTIFNCAYRGEDVRFVSHLRLGRIFIMNEELSVYRIHEKGIWQGKSQMHRDIESALSALKFSEIFGYGFSKDSVYKLRFTNLYHSIFQRLENAFCCNEKEAALLSGLILEMSKRKEDWGFLCESVRKKKYLNRFKHLFFKKS